GGLERELRAIGTHEDIGENRDRIAPFDDPMHMRERSEKIGAFDSHLHVKPATLIGTRAAHLVRPEEMLRRVNRPHSPAAIDAPPPNRKGRGLACFVLFKKFATPPHGQPKKPVPRGGRRACGRLASLVASPAAAGA